MPNTFTEADINQIKEKGISLSEIKNQIKHFKKGFPFLEIVNTATLTKGINKISPDSYTKYISEWKEYCSTDRTITKFVPASGAASRMFKDLFEFLNTEDEVLDSKAIITFFENISKFAFFSDLNRACLENYNKNINQLITDKQYKKIIRTLLTNEGLNYGQLPKGLLKFHSYGDDSRTPIEEHLVEASFYAKENNSTANLHFTVSPEHHTLFSKLIDKIQSKYENQLNTKFNITFSEQKSKTDTIAVDPNNEPFRDNGRLFFRPGGHGALLENLNDIDSDIIFIKNIDNVIPDKHKEEEIKFKQIVAGYLISIQKKTFRYLEIIDSGSYTRDILLEILYFVQDQLNVKNPETKLLEDGELIIYLKTKLNRPIRVCGMVPNIGEPGGGPFFTINNDKTISLQILESSQIDTNNPKSKELFNKGTHFNPVDLVCATKDYKGNKFDLKSFIDINTGFISHKSKNGKELKALELPGLWNGAMSNWNTVFVEVPLSTFNPVKTVNDLLRKEHQ